MPLNMANLATVLQAQINALPTGADPKTLLLLSKAIESAVGNIGVSDIQTAGTTQVGLVNTAGTTQIGLVNSAGAARIAAINALDALLKSGGTLAGPVRGTIVTLTDAATITPNFANAQLFKVTLGGNRTLGAPTITADMVGQSGYILIGQDTTGNRTLSAGAPYKTPGNAGISLTATASKWDRYGYTIISTSEIQLLPQGRGY